MLALIRFEIVSNDGEKVKNFFSPPTAPNPKGNPKPPTPSTYSQLPTRMNGAQ